MSLDMRRDPNRGFLAASDSENPARNYNAFAADFPNFESMVDPHRTDARLDPDLPMEGRIALRDAIVATMSGVPSSVGEDVLSQFVIETIVAPGCPEEPDTPVTLTYYIPPVKRKKNLPVLFFVTGGGLMMADPTISDLPALAMRFGAIVVAPKYRTILDGAKHPAALNDLHAAYAWMVENEKELGGSPKKNVVYAQSSGAHQALCLAFRLKRYGFDMVRGLVLGDPILEDRPIFHSMQLMDTMWNNTCNHYVNMQYFGRDFCSPLLGPEAFANRATAEECRGLPPIWMVGAELDCQSDAILDFSRKCHEAGVPVEVHQYMGISHGFAVLPNSGTRAEGMIFECIAEAFENDMRRPWNADGWTR